MSGCAPPHGLAPALKPEAGADTDLFAAAAAAAARRYRLSTREQQALEGVLRGHTRSTIAEALGVHVTTVKWHLHHVYAKLEVEHADAAVRKALFLDDPRWLGTPLRNRDALERLALAADQVVQLGKLDRNGRLTAALAELERELAEVRRDAGLASTYLPGDDQVALPLEPTP